MRSKKRLQRLAAAVVATVTLASLAALAVPAASQPVGDQSFSAYGTGTVVGLNALRLGNTQVLNAQVGFAAQSVNSKGLGTAKVNELGYAAQPSLPGKDAYGRGTGLEVGLLTPAPANPDLNQILLAGLAQSSAPPNAGPVTKQIGPINLGPILWANLLRGQASSAFDTNTCVVGKPFSYGNAEVAKVQLLNTGGTGAGGQFLAPLVETSLPADRNVAQTRTFSYLVANGDGTFGVISETHETVLPVSLLNGAITIELLGEWVLRTTATGKPGGAKVEYAPAGAGPSTPVLRIKLFNSSPIVLTLQQLLGPNGLDLSIGGVLALRVGTPPRPIGNDTSPQPPAPVAADGTSASAAVDAVSLKVLNFPGLTGLDLRIGHMESAVTAPSGGVHCDLPVSKAAGASTVNAGGTVNHTITIPSDGGAFAALFDCDLTTIAVQDVVSVQSGNPTFSITSASNGGVISADKKSVSWANVGPYHPGDPPIVLTVGVTIGAGSAGGVLQDTATVTGTLGNCRGGAGGSVLVGKSGLNSTVIGGTTTFSGPTVVGGNGGTTTTLGGAGAQVNQLGTPTAAGNGNNALGAPTQANVSQGGGALGRTGFDVAVFVAVAALLVVIGGLTVQLGRRNDWAPFGF